MQSICELGQGNVNDTYLVITDASQKNKYVLQRINQSVFKHPHLIAENIDTVSRHIKQKLEKEPTRPDWKIISLINCLNGDTLYKESEESIWRMTSFAENTKIFQKVDSAALARETGKALGRFHFLLFDLNTSRLNDTLPGYHHTPLYLEKYDRVVSGFSGSITHSDIEYCRKFVESRRSLADTIEKKRLEGKIATSVIHGDPKIDNILFNEVTNEAIGMIDLDTVKPGLLHYDIGDCLRSVCNPAGEETRNLDRVLFNLDFAKEWLAGYLDSANEILTLEDKSLFYEAVWVISFELGLRFLTDYLEGNVYFKTRSKDQNLKRAQVQFKLAEDIEAKERQIRNLITDVEKKTGSG